ncbi:hypothetical protein NQU55_33280 [Streptomyces sp. AA8]|uniref:Uncharacterized protein n=3 Tax=Streptomyces telluris TaxID=2720021 RepID=A0A9X2RQ42_9ACTN|nr:hypothetical protein [Streptomyces telluris]MCQ8774597.1 hypothetical protein [Streptomyces telluris]
MNRMRTAVAAVLAAGALWLAGGAGPASADEGGGGDGGVHLLLNSAYDNRPGELVDIEVQGIRTPGDVTVSSPVFPRPVRLALRDDGHHARPAIAMTTEPGTYPLKVRAGGRVVAEERVEVKPSERPSFSVTSPGEVLRPGERLWMSYDGLYPGETGRSFAVSSPAFRAPVRLAHDPSSTDWNNPRLFSGAAELPPGTRDGTYKVTLYGPGGRVVDEKPLVVRAARPGDRDYVGRARGPAFFGASAGTGPEAARARGHRVPAGGTVNVLWRDRSPDPGEEERLTATSPAFERPVRLRRDDTKAADGDDPRYFGPARIRRGLAPGSYAVTVSSHHGRVKKAAKLQVTEAAAGPSGRGAAGSGASGTTVAYVAGGTTAGVLAAAGLGVLLRRRAAR